MALMLACDCMFCDCCGDLPAYLGLAIGFMAGITMNIYVCRRRK